MNDFEQRLRSQRQRPIPESWRNEILSQARASAASETSGIRHLLSRILHPASSLHDLLWPHPRAWAGLAAIWLVIGWLNWSASRSEPSLQASHRPKSSIISSDQFAWLTEQRRMQRELLGSIPINSDGPVDRSKSQPFLKPQSALAPVSGFA